MACTNNHNDSYELDYRDKKGEKEMSDTFILCPKCGEELVWVTYDKKGKVYWCHNCKKDIPHNRARKVTTEYLKGEEDE